jgi:hypothetical protein
MQVIMATLKGSFHFFWSVVYLICCTNLASFFSVSYLPFLSSADGNQGSKKTTSAGPEKILMLPYSLG